MTLIARLRIILNDVDPQPMRQIEVPLKLRLDRLHDVIQAAMGWTDTHLYEFRVGDAGWGVPDPDGFYDGPMAAKKTTLEKLLEETAARTIRYVYDFGDDWDHSIRIERFNEATPGVSYPRLLKATGACPPEDVGGAWGYEEFLEALADPDHGQHEDMVRWSGGSFDPEDARIDSIIERFDRLAKEWAPRPRKPKATLGESGRLQGCPSRQPVRGASRVPERPDGAGAWHPFRRGHRGRPACRKRGAHGERRDGHGRKRGQP